MTTIIQDTFTDTGGTLLKNHTPDVGGAWKHRYFDLTGFTDGTVDLSGGKARLAAYGGYPETWHYNLTTPDNAHYGASIDVEFPGGYNAAFEIALTLRGVADNAVFGYLYVSPTGDSQGQISIDGDGALTEATNTGVGTPLTLGVGFVVHTVRFEVTGNTYTLFWDGAEVHQRSIPELGATGYAGFALQSSNFTTGDLVVDNFTVYATPPPASAFWTANVGTTEIFS